MASHLLLVGDGTALSAPLAAAGYRVTLAADARAAVARARDAAPDVVLVDLALPGLDAAALVHAIRLDSDRPLLLLAACGREAEKIAALDEGADDYVDAPADPVALIGRIRIAERRRARVEQGAARFAGGGLAIDFPSRRVSVGGRPVRLSPKEYALLRVLAHRAGQVIGHRRLLQAGWGPSATDTQYLRVYIGLLRQKIEEDPSDPRLIVTEPGIGYRLSAA